MSGLAGRLLMIGSLKLSPGFKRIVGGLTVPLTVRDRKLRGPLGVPTLLVAKSMLNGTSSSPPTERNTSGWTKVTGGVTGPGVTVGVGAGVTVAVGVGPESQGCYCS